jgi:hypothetical protein
MKFSKMTVSCFLVLLPACGALNSKTKSSVRALQVLSSENTSNDPFDQSNASPDPANTNSFDGAAYYNQYCAACHTQVDAESPTIEFSTKHYSTIEQFDDAISRDFSGMGRFSELSNNQRLAIVKALNSYLDNEIVTEFAPNEQRLFLLTQTHIGRTLRNILGTGPGALDWQQPKFSIHGSNDLAAVHSMVDTAGYFQFTERVVENNFAKFLTCPVASLNEVCVQNSIQSVGKKLFRRSLQTSEVEKFKSLAMSQGAGSLVMGTKYAMIAILNSPSFLYQSFFGVNGTLTPNELAAKIGFSITFANPDDTLIDAAESGTLATPDGIGAQVNRLLSNSALVASSFSLMMLEAWGLNLPEESFTANLYAEDVARWSGYLRGEFVRSAENSYTLANGDWRNILTRKTTFVNKALAEFYGITPVPANNSTWNEVPVSSKRGGVLASGLVMVSHSGNKYTSTTHRGLFIVNDLLCDSVPAPPENIDDIIEMAGPIFNNTTDTVKERIDKLSTVSPCSGCHTKFDSFGFVFENYDQFGRFFENRFDAPVYTKTVIRGESVEDPEQLVSLLLKRQDDLAECLMKKLHFVATSHHLENLSTNMLLAHGLKDGDQFNFKKMLESIVTHKTFPLVLEEAAK